MKLRTTGNSIRLRLSQSDVKTFAETGQVEERVRVGISDANVLSYRLIRSDDTSQTAATFENNCLTVSVPNALAEDWAATDRVGVDASQPTGPDSQLNILIEKDFACLTPRTGDEDKNAFPHPAASLKC